MRTVVRRGLVVLSLLVGLALLVSFGLLVADATREPTEARLAIQSNGEYEAAWSTHEPFSLFLGANDEVSIDGASPKTGAHETTFLKSDSFPWLVALTTHRAPLGALAAGTSHTYQVPRGAPRAFHVAARDTLSIVVLGDTGLNEHDEAFAKQAAALHPDLILHVGDLAYAFNDESKWERWMAALAPASEGAPFMPVPGNHEKEYGEAYRNYDARFAPGGVHHGSYNLGPAHVVHLDSEDMDATQDAWLHEDLSRVDRQKSPWVIAVLHRPLYSSGLLHSSSKPAREHFEALFDEFHVNLVLAGHEHNYERSFPVVAERPRAGPGPYAAADGPIYVVTGGGGATLYPDFLAQPWSVKRAAEHEMLQLALTREALRGVALREDGSSLDSFDLRPG